MSAIPLNETEIARSGLFDEDWYIRTYPDVAMIGMRAAEHYLWIGGRLGRSPSPKFDAKAYIEANPELRETRANPLLHYLRLARGAGAADLSRVEAPAGERGPILKDLHRLAGQAAAKAPPENATDAYRTVRSGFDFAYYLARYPEVARSPDLDPVEHYVGQGVRQGRDPHPDFSTRHYVQRYPEVAKGGANPFVHWIEEGRAEARIAAPFKDFEALCAMLGRAPTEVQDMLSARRRFLRARLERGVLGRMFAKAAEIEPLVALSAREGLTAPKTTPFGADDRVSEVVAAARLHEAAGFRRAAAVVVIPHCRLSGATRIAGHLAEALAGRFGVEEVLVVRTDLSILTFPDWFPAGCRHVDFAQICGTLAPPRRQRLLAEFIRSLRPELVFNVNSRLFWDMLKPFGVTLSKETSMYAYFFCNEKDVYGHMHGYPLTNFYRYFDILSGVITDSHYLADELRTRHMVPPEQHGKIVTLETPVSGDPQPVRRQAGQAGTGRRRVYWAGRFDRQKRVDIVYALAARMPNVDFLLWGEPVLDAGVESLARPANVRLQGVYGDLSEIPLDRCDVWLYTAEWDGVPNMLIEIAALGIPLVGSLTGGTGEILIEGMSWPVADIEDVDAYARGIREALAHPVAAQERAGRLRDFVIVRRSGRNYADTLQTFVAGTRRP